MKRDVGLWVRQCANYQKLEAEHQKPSGLLQPLEILVWKWDSISMDFIDWLPRSNRRYESIWVILDRLTKSAHFIPIKLNRMAPVLAKLFMKNVVRLHRIPSSIVSDRDSLFTSEFWKKFQESLGTKLKMSTAYHP